MNVKHNSTGLDRKIPPILIGGASILFTWFWQVKYLTVILVFLVHKPFSFDRFLLHLGAHCEGSVKTFMYYYINRLLKIRGRIGVERMSKLDEILARLQKEPELMFEYYRAERFYYKGMTDEGDEKVIGLKDTIAIIGPDLAFFLDDKGRWHQILKEKLVEVVYPETTQEFFNELHLDGITPMIE